MTKHIEPKQLMESLVAERRELVLAGLRCVSADLGAIRREVNEIGSALKGRQYHRRRGPGRIRPAESKSDPRFKFRLLRDIRAKPPKKDWLIKGIFALGETSAWIAPPGKLKSALIGEASFAIASNLPDWHSYKVKKSGAVIYFALERVSLVERRLVAYQARAGEESDDPPIAVVPGIFDLMEPSIVDHVLAIVRDVEKAVACPVVMIVLDTFAKTIPAGGGGEDKAKDQGKVFANIQRIKDALGANAPHVAIIGHTGKDESRGSRGSNAIVDDVDLMVTITGDGAIKTATPIKSNDGEERPLFSFKSELVEDGADDDGEPMTINIVSQEDVLTNPNTNSAAKLTKNQATMFELLQDAGSPGLLTKDWDAKGKEAGVGEKRRADLTDARMNLKRKNLVREYADKWHVNRS